MSVRERDGMKQADKTNCGSVFRHINRQILNVMKIILLYGWAIVCVFILMTMVPGSALANEPAMNITSDINCVGTITFVDPQKSMLVVRGYVSTKTFNLGSSCIYVLINNRIGTINDLSDGQKVKVFYQDANGVLAADRVEQQSQDFEGRVTAIDSTNRTLALSGRWSDKTFEMASNCLVVLHNNPSGPVADIQTGNHVVVNYEILGKTPVAWQINDTSDFYTGTLTGLDPANRWISATALFGTKMFRVADTCAIVVNGKPDGQLSDLKPGEQASFGYDDINGVNVANHIASYSVESAPNSTYITQRGTGN